jgi:prepilin-type N-terminal cleavage/methylation domain-containing protein
VRDTIVFRVRRIFRGNSGFSLLEVMVAVVIFSVAAVFLYHMLFSGRMHVEFQGERRMALKLAQYKAEELLYAGYGSTGDDTDWTSVNLTVGTHPLDDPTVVIDNRGTAAPEDDLTGAMTWDVTEVTLPPWNGVSSTCKLVDLTIVFPEAWGRDEVRVVTLIGSV